MGESSHCNHIFQPSFLLSTVWSTLVCLNSTANASRHHHISYQFCITSPGSLAWPGRNAAGCFLWGTMLKRLHFDVLDWSKSGSNPSEKRSSYCNCLTLRVVKAYPNFEFQLNFCFILCTLSKDWTTLGPKALSLHASTLWDYNVSIIIETWYEISEFIQKLQW